MFLGAIQLASPDFFSSIVRIPMFALGQLVTSYSRRESDEYLSYNAKNVDGNVYSPLS